MKVRIEIDTSTFVRFWLVVIGFGFAILALYSARTALVIIGIAFFFAMALNGPVSRLARYLPGKSRLLSTAIAFTLVVASLAAVLFLVVPPIIQQTMKFIDHAPETIRAVSDQWHGLGNLIDKYHLQPQIDKAVASVQSDAGRWATGFSQNVLSGVGSAFSMFLATVLMLVLTFLMLVEGPMWMNRLMSLYRDVDRRDSHLQVLRRMHAVVSGFVTGQITISAIDGLCAGLAVFLISLIFPVVPANLAMVAIATCFTLSLIPMFGATMAGALVTVLLAFNSIPAAIAFAIYFLVYQQIENNVIGPTVQSRKIDLSPLAILVAVTIGLYVFGLAGGIISIPIAGCIKVLVEEYLNTARKARIENEKPLVKLVKKISGEEI
ncbi:MAG: AI-2E family transporter [Candidatus Saccharimonas sp.]|nr:AI-2E family transporter [Candidatus Saccharimonas sp.]